MTIRQHETLLQGKEFDALSRALERLEIKPESTGTWFHSPDSPAAGWPVDFEATDPVSGQRSS